MSKDDEMIVCVTREESMKFTNGDTFTYCDDKVEDVMKWLKCRQVIMRRGDVENNPEYKQIIPYCRIYHYNSESGYSHFAYERGHGVGEERLESRLSIGIGGHLREGETIYTGIGREFQEELMGWGKIDIMRANGYILDESTDVSSVHFGIVVMIRSYSPVLYCKEAELIRGGWRSPELLEAEYDKMEDWSKIVYDKLIKTA